MSKQIVINVNMDHLDGVTEEEISQLQEAYKGRVRELLAWTEAEIEFVDQSGEQSFRMLGWDIDEMNDVTDFYIQDDIEQAWNDII